MKNENYYVGIDMGTNSVGYAVTDEQYNLCKHKGEPMWGVTLFDEANLSSERRTFRTSRRRLDRRQQRVKLIMELFAPEISAIDENFYTRIQESYLYPESEDQKIRLFGSYEAQKQYTEKYPTIHHLIDDLMNTTEARDVRLVYIACSWFVAHRGHFLSEVDKNNIENVTDFKVVFERLEEYIERDEYKLPWHEQFNIKDAENALKTDLGITQKTKVLTTALFGSSKAPKDINETYEYNYTTMIKLLCGGKDSIAKLFGNAEYENLDNKQIALNMEDTDLLSIMQSIDESDAELISILKAIFDWSVLVNVLNGEETISKAKIKIYETHKRDLVLLKYFIKKYVPQCYNDIFRNQKSDNNYVAYIGKNIPKGGTEKTKKTADKETFCKNITNIIQKITPDENDRNKYDDMKERLSTNRFMPKQIDSDNRVIPYQLYWHELNKVLENAKTYLPFLNKIDEYGLSVAEKILSVFEFKIPYYVGPLKENLSNNSKLNHWMVRKVKNGVKSNGKIYPWNFSEQVDLDKSEEAFIQRMTNSCTYLPGEDVLPKNSLIYCSFEVLNEINNIKINGEKISVDAKQGIYNELFMKKRKVTVKQIRDYLESNGFARKDEDILSGLDISIKSSLKPYIDFYNLVQSQSLSYTDVENIIRRATYSEEKTRFKAWLEKEYPQLSNEDIEYVSRLKFKEFGRFSKKLLCEIQGVNKETGEVSTIIYSMWQTNKNFMELLSKDFTFADEIDNYNKEYYALNPQSVSERLEDMYISNAVKRPIIRTLDILKDIKKVCGKDPKAVFIEMARGSNEDQKGVRKSSRLQQIEDLYKKIDTEEIRELKKELDGLGDTANNKLQSDKLFLYFIQLGKCLYTNESINIHSLSSNGTYNIDHIYPRSLVKDDSIINNKILVNSKVNGEKTDIYPIKSEIREKMSPYWNYLNKLGLISDEKFKRLIRLTPFTEDEKKKFIARQLVETRQSTKVVASLIKELYPNTEVIYVKAGLVSDFRHTFNLPKSRTVNELHHAKDAYLNIAVGNVWHHKFSKEYYKETADNNIKPEQLFTHQLKCGDRLIWTGPQDKNRIVKNALKNTACITNYAFCRKGGFFDQNLCAADEGLFPKKKDMPTSVYGGYNKTAASFFVLVKYQISKKQDIMIMPVELLFAKEFLNDNAFAESYAKNTIGSILKKEVHSIEFLLNKRVIKINTMLSLDGLKVCITGKSGGGRQLGLNLAEAFKVSPEDEAYIKRLESFEKKRKDNKNIVADEEFDHISKTKNLYLYDLYIEKFQKWPYNKRPANPSASLIECKEKFAALEIKDQVSVLLQIQGLFGSATTANLEPIGGVKSAGVLTLSSSLSNWKKNYKDVRIIDRSPSGLFSFSSDNILKLL